MTTDLYEQWLLPSTVYQLTRKTGSQRHGIRSVRGSGYFRDKMNHRRNALHVESIYCLQNFIESPQDNIDA